jgi:hypothetical protein
LKLDEYICFLDRLGRRTYWIDGVPFSRYRSFFCLGLPLFASYDVEFQKVRRLLLTRALGVIYATEVGANKVLKFCAVHMPGYDLTHLQPRTRTKTRRGLERCKVRPVDWDQMRDEGLVINTAGLKRQHRRSRLNNAKWWERQCQVSAQFPDVLAWGAFVEKRLTSYVHVVIHDGVLVGGRPERVANISHFTSDSRYLHYYPNEALIFTMTKELLGSFSCSHVILGQMTDDPQLASWKRHMGFQELAVPCRVLANPVLRLAKHFQPKLKIYLN